MVISAGRPHPLVVRAMKLARNRRAATIAIADATFEVAKLADHRLYYSSEAPPTCARTSRLELIQALARPSVRS